MGLSSKKQTQTTQKSSSMTPTNPGWVTNSLQGYNSGVDKLAGTDPYSYITGPSQLQQQAFTGAQGLNGGSADFNSARGLLKSDYLNPYTDAVVNSSLNDYDANAGQTRAAQARSAAANGAFGGSRYGIQEAQTEGELARGRAALDSGLRKDAFNTAAGLEQNAAGLFANIGSASDAAQRADLTTQAELGAQQRGIANEIAQAPLTFQSEIGDLYGKGQQGLFKGLDTEETGSSTAKQYGSGMEQIGQAAQAAAAIASLFSDHRLKRDIKRIGTFRGHNVYSYRYLWSDQPSVGVLAQEVMHTGAVETGPGGFLTVNYGAL